MRTKNAVIARAVGLVWVILFGLVSPVVAGAPGDVFKVDGKVAAAALLTTPNGDRETRLDHNSPMLRLLDGKIAELDRRTTNLLRRFAAETTGVSANAAHVSTIHLLNGDGQDRLLQLFDDGGDLIWAKRSDGAGLVTLPRKRLDALAPGWDRHESGGMAAELPVGQIVDLPRPYVEGTVRLDSRAIKSRIDGGDQYYSKSGLTRKLEEELLWVRLPKGHDAAQPAGVMIWVSPTATWRIPPHFHEVLDELGLIACGADNADNPRNVTERLQLMFDALENVRQRYAIDEKRIYVTGFSGGGRCSTMLHLGWPEVFSGSVPIVGMNTYHRLKSREPGKIIAAQVGRPHGRRMDLAKQDRMWAFTGETDGNRYEMELRVSKMDFDGFDVKLTTVPGIGHEMPPVEELHEAVRWVDEPRREVIEKELELATGAIEAHNELHGGGAPETDAARDSLVEITLGWPWTEAAWEAAERLGYEKP